MLGAPSQDFVMMMMIMMMMMLMMMMMMNMNYAPVIMTIMTRRPLHFE